MRWGALCSDLNRMKSARGLSLRGYLNLALSYKYLNKYENCISTCNEFLDVLHYENQTNQNNPYSVYDVYDLMAQSYEELGEYDKAITYYEKFLEKVPEEMEHLKFLFLMSLAHCYVNTNNFLAAANNYKLSINFYCKQKNINLDNIEKGLIQDDTLGGLLYGYGFCKQESGLKKECDKLLILSAKCGDEAAIKYCIVNNLNYTSNIESDLF